MSEVGGRKGRDQMSEIRCQKGKGRGQKTEDRGQRSEDEKTEIRCQRSDVRRERAEAEVGGQRAEDTPVKCAMPLLNTLRCHYHVPEKWSSNFTG